ncbi:MAG: hypothetical protein JO069_03515 [Verrucomicrobia bacterium]|nr:hypothetical protein [Verrucomicrobiota bacterium]
MAGRPEASGPGREAPRNRGPNTTVLAALSAEGVLASLRIEGSANTEVFLTYLDQVLC